ncbi:MAG: septal ring lytic transglycosylase RlpA family protein [Rhodospirillales bacterium]|nr:septal ring lytic transglycosylase RlpA family protein [Rhodospirillales bacterium]
MCAIVFGVLAYEEPKAKPEADTQRGSASWYGAEFEGKKTASGERFDADDMTAAHRKLPLGTKVEVTNLDNGKTVEVEINDRGPYAKGRIIDLSKAAANKLGMTQDGTAPVEIEVTEPVTEQDSKNTAK